MLKAITRAVSRSITQCELTHLERVPIDLERARAQHAAYEHALRSLGVDVHQLAEEPELPDSVFVEDTAIVLDECALITRPGAESRRPETESIALALAGDRQLVTIQPPGTVDGGDVLVVDRAVYVGLTTRSNLSAVEQMQAALAPFGYQVRGVPVSGCLHLKSAVTYLAPGLLLINPAWVSPALFPGNRFLAVDPSEASAANALRVGDVVLYQPCFPKTVRALEAAHIPLLLVDASELAKAEGALTCCSLIYTV
jgi:dimethylargininase